MQQIAANLFTFTGLIVGRVYLSADKDGLTLIDASIPAAAGKIVKQLGAAGHKVASIKRIVLTHAHPDHVGAIPALQKQSDAQIICSELEAPVINGKLSIPSARRADLKGLAKLCVPPPTTLKDMTADRLVVDGEILTEVMDGLHAIHTPGHAPGHLSYWQPERKILFTGDTIFRMRSAMTTPWSFLTVDMSECIRSIKKLAELEPEIICFGHGEPITENATARLQAFARSL